MIKAAYSSGTPAYGVGVGNSVHVVDETADLDYAALTISRAKTFDYATSCLADNSVVAETSIYAALPRDRLVAAGGHLCTPEQKEQLVCTPDVADGGHIPTIEVVAKPAARIAELAGFAIPEDRSFLIVEEDGLGPAASLLRREAFGRAGPLSATPGGIGGAIDLVNRITGLSGTWAYLRHPHPQAMPMSKRWPSAPKQPECSSIRI